MECEKCKKQISINWGLKLCPQCIRTEPQKSEASTDELEYFVHKLVLEIGVALRANELAETAKAAKDANDAIDGVKQYAVQSIRQREAEAYKKGYKQHRIDEVLKQKPAVEGE